MLAVCGRLCGRAAGALRKAMSAWRSTLLRCLASTEAIIDFGEDEEISSDVAADVLAHGPAALPASAAACRLQQVPHHFTTSTSSL